MSLSVPLTQASNATHRNQGGPEACWGGRKEKTPPKPSVCEGDRPGDQEAWVSQEEGSLGHQHPQPGAWLQGAVGWVGGALAVSVSPRESTLPRCTGFPRSILLGAPGRPPSKVSLGVRGADNARALLAGTGPQRRGAPCAGGSPPTCLDPRFPGSTPSHRDQRPSSVHRGAGLSGGAPRERGVILPQKEG